MGSVLNSFMQGEKESSFAEALETTEDKTKETIPRQYMPLTEVCFYVLMALREERHGYEIMQWVDSITGGALKLQGGTIYNSLSRLEHDELIELTRADDRRKYYRITATGKCVLQIEQKRLERIYQNSRDKVWKNKNIKKSRVNE